VRVRGRRKTALRPGARSYRRIRRDRQKRAEADTTASAERHEAPGSSCGGGDSRGARGANGVGGTRQEQAEAAGGDESDGRQRASGWRRGGGASRIVDVEENETEEKKERKFFFNFLQSMFHDEDILQPRILPKTQTISTFLLSKRGIDRMARAKP